MGTRSLTFFQDKKNDKKPLCCVYRQFDGYPSGMGKDLQEILKGFKIVNGYGGDDSACEVCNKQSFEHKKLDSPHEFKPKRVANGMGCLAATVIGKLKEGIGNVYMNPPVISKERNAGQDYEYYIYPVKDKVYFKVVEFEWADEKAVRKTLYDGPVDDFDACKYGGE